MEKGWGEGIWDPLVFLGHVTFQHSGKVIELSLEMNFGAIYL